MINIKEIWNMTLKCIEDKIPQKIYENYFDDVKLLSLDKNIATVVVPNELSKTLLEGQYKQNLQDSLLEVTETLYDLKFILSSELEENTSSTSSENLSKASFFKHSKLNPNYTFDNFVVGESNESAYKASHLIADHLATLNPLFIYSASGLGKTHLMHAIGNYVLSVTPLKKVLYITAEDFVDEYVRFSTKRDKNNVSMKDFFITVDVFLIDDIQFLAEKTQTCEMFFHIFNLLVSNNKQIVITSDRDPKKLEGLEERLVSRFSSGLTVSIKVPEIDTLMNILKLKIKASGHDLNLFPDDVLLYLAQNNSKNVRELEGALNRIVFYNMINKNPGPITMDLVHQAFDNEVVKDHKGSLSPEKIISTTASYYNLAPSQLTSKVRINQITFARQIAIYLCRELLDIPFSQIGKIFSRDHSTIMSSVQKVENLLKDDNQTIHAINQLKDQLKTR